MAPAQGRFSWSNIAVGAVMNMFEVTTLGQPFEVIKTQMASNRTQTMYQALKTVWNRGGVLGFYQGLIPWAWIEASTKGAVLLFTSTEVQKVAKSLGMGPGAGRPSWWYDRWHCAVIRNDGFLHVYEDCGNHASKAGHRWCPAAVYLEGVC